MSTFGPISRPLLLAATLISLLLGSTRGGNLAETVEFREYVYEGLRNVRWEGSKETWDVGDPDTHKTKVENHCAALCTAKEMDCTGFYIDKTEVGGSCHLVNDDVLGGGSPTIGHGWRWLDVFYNKTVATYTAPDSPPPSFNLTDELTTPCDQDEDKLDQASCDNFTSPSAVPVEYLNCSKVTDNYPNTVNLISDLRCAGEDRLLQCELNGRQVQKSIPDDITVFDNMFYKSWMSARGLEVMSYGEGVKIDLPKPPRKLTRMIIRTVDTQEVEHMSKGAVIVYGQGGNEQIVPLDFSDNVLACVVHINFNKYPSITFAQEAYAVNITVDQDGGWKGIIKKKGIKIDLFIEDKNMQ